ncbi:DUF817 domain-containing protein [Spirillospora sp. CA-294931]|uniref:DUF817 domain-containing protein n=1 Tax=Spirillospora sp. CA-294931 TaxID=3240042 RepID=UPI003D9193EB
MRFAISQLWRFGWTQATCCAFAVGTFAGLALTQLIELPVPRYDALLVYLVLLTAAFRLSGLESTREIAVIGLFHLIGLAFEIVKVHMGSWNYPESAFTKVGGVPLYSGFLYAAVGSYVCMAWRRFELRLTGYRSGAALVVALGVYANFITHHWLPDLRIPLAVLLVLVTGRTTVHFTVGPRRYRMPLALSFLLIGFFLWVAENIATFLGAWHYPHQDDGWQLVHTSKFGAWALLVSVTFVLVAQLQARLGRLHEPEPLPGDPAPPALAPAPALVP